MDRPKIPFKTLPISDAAFIELAALLLSRVKRGRINMDKLTLTRHRYKCKIMRHDYANDRHFRCTGVRQTSGTFDRVCGEPCEFMMDPETGEKM